MGGHIRYRADDESVYCDELKRLSILTGKNYLSSIPKSNAVDPV